MGGMVKLRTPFLPHKRDHQQTNEKRKHHGYDDIINGMQLVCHLDRWGSGVLHEVVDQIDQFLQPVIIVLVIIIKLNKAKVFAKDLQCIGTSRAVAFFTQVGEKRAGDADLIDLDQVKQGARHSAVDRIFCHPFAGYGLVRTCVSDEYPNRSEQDEDLNDDPQAADGGWAEPAGVFFCFGWHVQFLRDEFQG